LIGTSGVMLGQQTNFPFQLLVTTPDRSTTVPNGSQIAFLAEIGQSQTAQIIATYQGIGTVSISQLPTLFGSTSFTVTATIAGAKVSLPATLNPGDKIAFDIVFKPAGALQVSSQFIQAFAE